MSPTLKNEAVTVIAEGLAREQAAELIERYPVLGHQDLTRLIALYRQLSSLDVALLLSDPHLSGKLDQFTSDHRSKLRTPFRQYGVLVMIATLGLGMTIWAMMVM